MQFRSLSVLLTLSTCLLTACGAVPGEADDTANLESSEQATAELRGGTIAGGAGVVVFQVKNSDGTASGCTGTVIAPRALITAAHCFDGALGNAVWGSVDVRVSYTNDGVNWQCISAVEAPGACSTWTTTWVRRLKGANDVYLGRDFAVLLSTQIANGPAWRGFTAFRGIDVTVPRSGNRFELWGAGVNADNGSFDNSMRHANFKWTANNRPNEVMFTKASSAGGCSGDSGGPMFRETTDWVNAIHVAHDSDGGRCANSGTSQQAYIITKNTINVINQELAHIDPFGINCGGMGVANRYRCFIPR
jgi:hypothetical protein